MSAAEREQKLGEGLSDDEWRAILNQMAATVDSLWLELKPGDDEEGALRQAIKKADRVLSEAQAAEARVSVTPEEREKLDDWTAARLELPAAHVRGGFVLWQKGRPASLIYPMIAARMPRFPIAALLQPHVASRLPPPGAPEASQELQTILLVVEASGLYNLNCMYRPANPYLVVTIGDPSTGVSHRLMTQPILDATSASTRGRDDAGAERTELAFGANERFLVFLDGDAQVRDGVSPALARLP